MPFDPRIVATIVSTSTLRNFMHTSIDDYLG